MTDLWWCCECARMKPPPRSGKGRSSGVSKFESCCKPSTPASRREASPRRTKSFDGTVEIRIVSLEFPRCYTLLVREGGEMIFLGENEMSCHAKSIGFPSIDNCRAIVMVTGGGLIGCHLFGTLEKRSRLCLVTLTASRTQPTSGPFTSFRKWLRIPRRVSQRKSDR